MLHDEVDSILDCRETIVDEPLEPSLDCLGESFDVHTFGQFQYLVEDVRPSVL